MSNLPKHVTSNRYVEDELHARINAAQECLDADVLTFIGPIYAPVDDLIRRAVEAISLRKKRLAVILETDGGQIETAERMATVFRRFYDELWFFVPNFAMSAGTVLVMCGDRIFMDYYSILGPIDPQVRNASGNFVPALGYLERFDELVEKSANGTLTTAETSYLVERFDPAELYSYSQARGLSIDLLKAWLVQWKFKDWHVTETSKKTVTQTMKEDRAERIADRLNDTKKWKSHARGLSMSVIERELDLKIDDIENDTKIKDCIDPYYKLLKDYMARRGHDVVIHTNENYRGLGGLND